MSKHVHKFYELVLTGDNVKTTVILCKCKETQSIVSQNIKSGEIIMRIGYFPDEGSLVEVKKVGC